ncbi:coagulation factor XIII B chain-like [Chelonoidis abingdonii]|uniref:coagulation factor XIII B chain-like n=1 Tax=Chelonoidis abingdonii TaxID=106734 RepID=UPI003F492183
MGPGDLTPASFCSPPPETNNGFHRGASYRAGGEVRYKCKRGYRLEGPETIRCQENQEWSGPAPSCHPVFCPPPGDIAEGYLVAVEKPQYRAGELVYYLCKRSYLLDGSNRVTCQSNGTWSPRPFCREPTWLQYQIFPKRVVSEIRPC